MSMHPLVADLLPEVVEGARRSFALLVDDVPASEVIGFALWSDADGGTVVAAAGTRATYDALVAQHPGAADHLRWSAQEWGRDFMTLRERGLADPLGPLQQLDALQDQADDGEGSRSASSGPACGSCARRRWRRSTRRGGSTPTRTRSGWWRSRTHELGAEQQVGWIERCNPPAVAAEFAAYVGAR